MFILYNDNLKNILILLHILLYKWIIIVKCLICLLNQKANLDILNQIIIKYEISLNIKITVNNPIIDNIEKIFYIHINEYDNKYEYYLVRCEVKLCFINMKE